MTYSVLKVPLNPNQPTNRLAALLHGTLVVGVSQMAALNRGRHLYLAGRPSRWALAHILVLLYFFKLPFRRFNEVTDVLKS